MIVPDPSAGPRAPWRRHVRQRLDARLAPAPSAPWRDEVAAAVALRCDEQRGGVRDDDLDAWLAAACRGAARPGREALRAARVLRPVELASRAGRTHWVVDADRVARGTGDAVELFFWAALRSAVEEAHAAADGGPVGLRGVRAAGRRLAGPGAGPRRCASRAREVLAYCRGVLARRPGDAAADCIALDLDG